MTKHDWECIKAPHHDKIVKCAEVRHDGYATLHPRSEEEIVLIPGRYMCKKCNAFLESNHRPLDDWDVLVQDCDEGQARIVMES